MSSTQRRTIRGVSARGWCPRDDRVYAFRDGVCPECGTSLVPIDPPAVPDPEIEIVSGPPEPTVPVRSPRTARMIVVAVVLGAFLVGLFVPRPDRNPEEARLANRASQDVRVNAVSRTSGGTLRLVRLKQSGDSFTAVFAAGEGFPSPGTIAGAAVEMRTRDTKDVFSDFGVSDQQLALLPKGFAIEGHLPKGHGRIIELRISSIQLRVHETPSWSVDLSHVWPVDGAVPKVLHVGSSRSAGDGSSLRLVAILGWHDRIEADFELRGSLRAGEVGAATIDGLEMSMSGEGDGLQDSWKMTLAAQQEQLSPSEILARFQGIPAGVRRVTIRATRVSRFLAGPWSWMIG